MRQLRYRLVRPEGQGLVEFERPRDLPAIQGEDLPLFCYCGSQRLQERPGGQDHLEGLAFRGLAGAVPCRERDPHPRPRQRMLCEVAAGQPLDLFGASPGQFEREGRQRVERGRIRFRRIDWLDDRLGVTDAVIVLALEGYLQCTVHGTARLLVEGDLRGAVGNDVERPGLPVDRKLAAPVERHQIGAPLRELACRGSGRRCGDSDLRRLSVARRRLFRSDRLFAHEDDRFRLCGRSEGHGLLAVSAGQPDGQFRVLWLGERCSRAGRVPGEEDRRAAGIGRRRQPGIDPEVRGQIERCRGRAEGIADRSRAVGEGEAEGDDQQERGNGAQGMPVMSGDVGLRQSGVEGGDPLRHADLVLLPQRAGEGGVVGERIVLHRDRLVRQVVSLLEQTVGISRGGPAYAGDRQKRYGKRDPEGGQQDPADHVRHEAEEAEPCEGEEEGCDPDDGQEAGYQPFEEEHRTGEGTLPGNPSGKPRKGVERPFADIAHAIPLLWRRNSTPRRAQRCIRSR